MKVAQLAQQHLQAPKSDNAGDQTGCAPARSASHAGQLVARSAAHCLPQHNFVQAFELGQHDGQRKMTIAMN